MISSTSLAFQNTGATTQMQDVPTITNFYKTGWSQGSQR
jgi:hypothetical protein